MSFFSTVTIPANVGIIPVDTRLVRKVLYLPTVSTNAGRFLLLKDYYGTSFNSSFTISTTGTDLIDDVFPLYTFSNAYGGMSLVADGRRSWRITDIYNGAFTPSQGFFPTQYSGLLIWTDASSLGLANNTVMTTWTNGGSGGTVNCTGTYITAQLNGLGIVRFATTATWTIASQPNLSAYSFFFVSRQTGGTNRRVFQSTSNNQLYGYYNGQKRTIYIDANPNQLTNVASDTAWDLFSHTRTAGLAYTFNWNGTSQFSSASSTTNNFTGLAINSGTYGGESSNCEVAEIILYNVLLTTAQVQTVEGYLAWKWGLQGNLPANHPYKNAPP